MVNIVTSLDYVALCTSLDVGFAIHVGVLGRLMSEPNMVNPNTTNLVKWVKASL
jgi:hypothetical protein